MITHSNTRVRLISASKGGRSANPAWPHSGKASEVVANPNDLIDTIVDAIDYAELAKDSQGLIKARRLLNNDLRQAIDIYVQGEVTQALLHGSKGIRRRPAAAI
jgi:hypothetical protein